ncbi:hypothetical protein CH35J_007070 [Colletotrichum higginsianum]|uniref:Uncharacterized protein n=1 Tax=Colletotrichum higginsianum TaxID=80884 RepID=A0A4V4NBR5_9PEZI|nr:hypothetical protein CH35J_007070 [Colletotrichum higginsianum]
MQLQSICVDQQDLPYPLRREVLRSLLSARNGAKAQETLRKKREKKNEDDEDDDDEEEEDKPAPKRQKTAAPKKAATALKKAVTAPKKVAPKKVAPKKPAAHPNSTYISKQSELPYLLRREVLRSLLSARMAPRRKKGDGHNSKKPETPGDAVGVKLADLKVIR